MFTGIVEELGVVEAVVDQHEAVRLTVRGAHVMTDTRLGDSIAVNGVCLTVTDPAGSTDGTFTVELVPETLKRTIGLPRGSKSLAADRPLIAPATAAV